MSLNLRQKIAQTLCFGFKGAEFEQALDLKRWLSHPDGIGSLILFDYEVSTKTYGKNIKSLHQLGQLNSDIKSFYRTKHPEHPNLWLSIDVEGGRVDRLAQLEGYALLPSAKKIANLSVERRNHLWQEHAKCLQTLNIDLNFAPVVDLELSPGEGIFGPLERCYSADPKRVLALSQAYIEILNQYGILACLKHFPGHGSAKGDSHLDFVDVSATFQSQELQTFSALIQQKKLDFAMMTAHVINRQLDMSGKPATLSKSILDDLLRQEFGYQGIIISDDLQMQAISKYYSRSEAIRQTLSAGADLLIFGNQLGWDEPQDIIDEIYHMVVNGLLTEKIIDRAYQRIMSYKLKLRG